RAPPDVQPFPTRRSSDLTAVAGRRSEALALDYLRARGQTGAARAHALRGVGDRALYISGVAPRSLHRTPVDVRYVQGIGEAAYRDRKSTRLNSSHVKISY